MVLSVTCFRASSRRGCDEGVRTDTKVKRWPQEERGKRRERERGRYSLHGGIREGLPGGPLQLGCWQGARQ